MVKGIGVSSGIAIGRAFVLPHWDPDVQEKSIEVADLAQEFERLYQGIRTSKQEIEVIKQEISDTVGTQESSIFDAHLAILDDPVFMNEIEGIIRRQYKAAEVAVKEVTDKFVNMFDLLDDDYMKERALDIKDVGNRLLKHLLGAPEVTLPKDNRPFILVAKELSPSQLAHLNPVHVRGIVTTAGGINSHAAIMARAMGIPFVLGLDEKLAESIETGDLLIIDGDEGTLFINPDSETADRYRMILKRQLEWLGELQQLAGKEARTMDGMSVRIGANISSANEVSLALTNGASGVGLFRTEFLYMDRRTWPTENELFEAFRDAAVKLDGKPLIIRTLDIGGDKQLEYFHLPKEDNPFLGYRAIRISLSQTDQFKTQLRAIWRAAAYGNVKIMLPMIASVNEVRQAKQLLEDARHELADKGVPYGQRLPFGIMIEVPSAAAIADLLAREVDFFSIGTNDLIQYVLAVDRMNDQIADLYDPYHPAILRLLRQIVEAAKQAGIPVSVCGELAGDVRAVPIWLALGVEELSMSAKSILKVKSAVIESNRSDSVQLLQLMMQCSSSEEIERLLSHAAPMSKLMRLH